MNYREIARLTRRACAANGMGTKVAVFADRSAVETSDLSPIGRDNGNNGIEWARAYFTRPSTTEQVREMLSAATSVQEAGRKGGIAARGRSGRPRSAPRCPCGAMTVKRALARRHRCAA